MAEVVETLEAQAAAADDALLTGEEAPTPAEPVETPVSPPEPSSGPARDPQGRFASPPPAETPAPEAGQPPSEPAVEPVDAAPFTYNADNQEITIDGSAVGEDGLFIPTAKVPEITQLLAEGHAWRGSAQRYFQEANTRQQATERRAVEAETRAAAAETQAKAVLAHFEQLIDASRGVPPEQMLETPMGRWLMDVASNWGVLKAESKAQALELQLQARQKQVEETGRAEKDAQLRPQMDSALGNWISHYGQKAGLEKEILERLYADLKAPQYEKVLFVRADYDDPANGVRKGDLAIDHSIIEREIRRIADFVKPKAPMVKTASARPTVATVRPKVPPTISATKGPAPKKAVAKPKNKEEADEWLLYGAPDEADD